MSKRRVRNEAFDNLHRVAGTDNPDVVGQMDIVMADAVQDSIKNEEHIEEVTTQMKKDAEIVAPESPKDEKNPVENNFTAKLVLDESLEEFTLQEKTEDKTEKKVDGRSNKFIDDDGTDTFLDYDMFDFVYGLVTDCYPVPLNPIQDIKKRKFMYIGSDKYKDRPENSDEIDAFDLHTQVSSEGDKITIYANEDRVKDEETKEWVKAGTVTAFDWIKAVCELYKFKYSGPNPRRNSESHWEYSFTIQVPCESGYPMMVEDYFETLGLSVEDVMPETFVKGYRKAQAKEQAEAKKYLDSLEVERKIKNAITAAAQDNTLPLETHLKRLFAELTSAGLKYQKKKVKQEFMDAFDDGEEEDD